MSFDNSRFTFNPRNDYSGVVMQQGRVQLDSDWNEWLAELTRRMQAGTLDILGRAVYPATTPHAFEITAQGGKLLIGPGRMYVDGVLAENHGDPAAAQWDPALGEMSDAPQPPFASATEGAIDYTQQPYMPPNTALPAENGPFLAYLDVWTRPVDYINDPELVDAAVGVDSTGRLQTVWQVRLMDLANSPGASCDTPISGWPPPASAGLLTTGTTPTAPPGPCCLTSGAAYTGLENQFYRVEIHQPGTLEGIAVPPSKLTPGIATFKWSRDNGSVITGVTSIANVTNSAGDPASQVAVQSLGRDQVLGFAPGNWIEILDDATEFGQTYGELHQIDTIDFAAKTITLATTLGAGFPPGDTDPGRHTRIRRWDQSGKVYEQDGTTVWWDIDAQGSADIPVPPAGTSLILENGITVSFDLSSASGALNVGDFWSFAARTATGKVEELENVAPRGIHHHYTRLAIVNFPDSASDCRTKWPPSTSDDECGCCCTYTVGDGVSSFGKYTSINDAINALPLTGGEVCILPGRYFENVVIRGKRDVVLRGCGWQTRIASASLKPEPPPAIGVLTKGDNADVAPVMHATAASSGGTLSKFGAVITVAESQHIKLISFAVEAAEREVGVLIDGTGKLSSDDTGANDSGNDNLRSFVIMPTRTVDVTIEDLVITASRLPAILADSLTLLHIEKNRIAMENVRSAWPAVWVRGQEIRIVHNWVGLRSREWLPDTVVQDIASDSNTDHSELVGLYLKVPLHHGGIQIAGPSKDVFVVENEIDGAARNGITLGGLVIVNKDGQPTGGITGGTVEVPGPCDTTITLQIPGEGTVGGLDGGRIVAAGKLLNIQIDRNRIRNTGLCGIGPVGFFNLLEEMEVISIENLTIAANAIESTLQGELQQPDQGSSVIGYGAICIPDVLNLTIRDNEVTDFGRQPGDRVCGVFILHGEQVEISRNNIEETRDWNEQGDQQQTSGLIGGIVLFLVTPPTLTSMQSFSNTSDVTVESLSNVYLPNVPALRVEHNVVRVALGNALEVMGLGCFSIVNNHLATGGMVATKQSSLAETVLILNLSASIESAGTSGKYSSLSQGQDTASDLAGTTVNPSCGAVVFTQNICQLEARRSRQRGSASVLIFALDDLIFSNNECWVDGPRQTAVFDALLAAGTLQATSNRFQEAAGLSVLASGFTLGALNITTQNISTYCLFATGTLQPAIASQNLCLVPVQLCDAAAEKMKLQFTK